MLRFVWLFTLFLTLHVPFGAHATNMPVQPAPIVPNPTVAAAPLVSTAAPKSLPRDGALMTGKTLVSLCQSRDAKDRFACHSYIAGVVDYHRLLRGLGTAPTVDFCMPEGTTMETIQPLVTRYVITHSEHHDFVAAPAIAMALFESYPCKRKR